MKPSSGRSFKDLAHKSVLVFGMSGVGKTSLASLLRRAHWFHYSVDYRIGTRYMGEYIASSYKTEAMKVPLFRALLRSDSIAISSKISFHNLTPLSTYLGKPGNPTHGGLSFEDYQIRQRQHQRAEINAMLDVPHFMGLARNVYGYEHFICDASGSLCEVVNPADETDPVLTELAKHCVFIYIRAETDHLPRLIERFQSAPKPMYYQEDFLVTCWQSYKAERGLTEDSAVDPDDFAVWGYTRLMHNRLPKYEALARRYGYILEARDVEAVRTADDFTALVARTIDAA